MTWRRLLNWTDGQAPSERLAAQVLLAEGYERLDPSQPLGGADGRKDALMIRDGEPWIMAVYFPTEQRSFAVVRAKFVEDYEGARANSAVGMAFVTNQKLTVEQRSALGRLVPGPVDIYHLERLVTVLDQPRMGSVRRRFGFEPRDESRQADPVRDDLLGKTRESHALLLEELRLTADHIPTYLTRLPTGQVVTADQLLGEINVRDSHGILILGPARAGKTYLATWISERLSQVSDTICVIVPLSRWDGDVEIAPLLLDFMHDELHVTRQSAADLLNAGAVFPVFDGIDELASTISADRSAAFFAAVDRWRSLPEPRPCLMTGRQEVWELLPDGVRATARLDVFKIEPISKDEALGFYLDELRRQVHPPTESDLQRAFAAAAHNVDLTRPAELAMLTRMATDYARAGMATNAAPWTSVASTNELYAAFLETRLASESNPWRRFRNAAAVADLSSYARYLKSNPTAVLANEHLESKDLLLHRLWPASGTRLPRVLDMLLALVMSIPGLVWLGMFAYDIGLWALVLVSPFYFIWLGLLIRTTWKPWVNAGVPDWSRLKDKSIAVRQLGAALAAATVAWMLTNLAVAFAVLVVAWVAIGLTVGFGQTLATNNQIRVLRPNDVLRRELQVSLVASLAVTPLLAVAFASTFGWRLGVPAAVVYGLAVGFTVASALWRRYLAMVLCRLPALSTPGQSLARAHTLDVVRVAGLAYQFRDDQFLDFFAASTRGLRWGWRAGRPLSPSASPPPIP